MHQDFKLILNLTKGYKDSDGRLFVEGIASGTELDLTGERMSESAIKAMANSLNKGIVEFRSEHSSDWDSMFGEVVELAITDDNQLKYRAELDPGFSKSHDLLHALAKGKKLGVSIGGHVIKAGMEWVEELQRSVYTYFDIALNEISVTAQPAYATAWVSTISKSINRNEVVMAMDIPQKKAVPAERIHGILAEVYPERVLGWVKDATWRKETSVPLDSINMARRPGGRDQKKVEAIAAAIAEGKQMDPVVLVDDGTDKFQIADGYHRTLAFKHANKTSIAAYIASGVEPGGPWEKEMHDAKLNKSTDEAIEQPADQAPETPVETPTTVEPSEQEVPTPEATKVAAAVADAEATPAEEAVPANPAPEPDQEPANAEATSAEAEAVDTTKAMEAPSENAATDPAPAQEADAPEATSDPVPVDEGASKPSAGVPSDEVESLNKSLQAKAIELEAAQKSFADVTKQLEASTAKVADLEKSLAETQAKLEATEQEKDKLAARKALVFGKYESAVETDNVVEEQAVEAATQAAKEVTRAALTKQAQEAGTRAFASFITGGK